MARPNGGSACFDAPAAGVARDGDDRLEAELGRRDECADDEQDLAEVAVVAAKRPVAAHLADAAREAVVQDGQADAVAVEDRLALGGAAAALVPQRPLSDGGDGDDQPEEQGGEANG